MMWFTELFERERGTLVTILITVFVSIIFYRFDYFYLRYWLGDEVAFAVYALGFYVLYFLSSIVHEALLQRKIKIVKSHEYHDEHFTEPYKGKAFYGYLDVVVPVGWKITDCYVTLEKIFPVYYEDRVSLDESVIEKIPELTSFEYKMLQWRSPARYQDGTKINIGENSNRETFSVGKIITGDVVDTNGKITKIKTFTFDVQRINPNAISFTRMGLYDFTIKFHWKRNGREMISKIANGYIYSRAKDGVREIRVGVGGYNSDNDIPRPIMKVEKDSDHSNLEED